MAAPDYSGITSDIQGGYDSQRLKAQQQEGANLQGQRDALNRRAAQLGGGPSGALIKVDQQAQDQSAQRLQSANEGINQAQNQELRGVKMTQLGQQFQTGEREAGQAFQQAQQGREFGQQSALQGAGFGEQEKLQNAGFTQQSATQKGAQDFQGQQTKAAQDWQAAQTKIAQGIQQGQFDTSLGFEKQKFDEQTGVDQFNEQLASKMAGKKDALESLFSNFSMGNITKGLGMGGAGAIVGSATGLGPVGGYAAGQASKWF